MEIIFILSYFPHLLDLSCSSLYSYFLRFISPISSASVAKTFLFSFIVIFNRVFIAVVIIHSVLSLNFFLLSETEGEPSEM